MHYKFAHTSLSIRAIGFHNYYYIQWDVTDKHTYIEFNIDPVRWTDWIYILHPGILNSPHYFQVKWIILKHSIPPLLPILAEFILM